MAGSRLLNGGGEARAHLVSTITIGSQIEPPVGGDRMDRHDVVPVIVSVAGVVGLLSMAAGLATGHLVGELVSSIASPFLAVGASS
jgi:hypothetical protein